MNSNTFSGICARLGAPLHDPRWSWCALAPDGKLAVFTVWQDKFQGLRYPILYYDSPTDHPNPDRPGANEIVRVVEHCLANPDTEVPGILSGAHQPIRDPRVREWRGLTLCADTRNRIGRGWTSLGKNYWPAVNLSGWRIGCQNEIRKMRLMAQWVKRMALWGKSARANIEILHTRSNDRPSKRPLKLRP